MALASQRAPFPPRGAPPVTPLGTRAPTPNRSISIIALLSGAAIMLGYAREAAVAFYFGAGLALDCFILASSVPRVLGQNLAAATALGLLPHVTRTGSRAATFRRFAIGYVAVCVALTLAVVVLAPLIAYVLAPGFAEADRAHVTLTLRLVAPLILLFGVTGLSTAILEGQSRFVATASSGAVISVFAIAACVTLAPSLGMASLVIGTLAGAAAVVAVQLAAVLRHRDATVEPSGRVDASDGTRGVVFAVATLFVNGFAAHAYGMIDRAFASHLGAGAVSYLNYAQILIAVPLSIGAVSVVRASFPIIADHVNHGRRAEAGDALRGALGRTVAVLLPCAVLLAVFAPRAVALLFGSGAFGEAAIAQTAMIAEVLAFSLVLAGSNTVLRRGLIACGAPHHVLRLTLLALAMKVPLSWVLSGWYGLVGLALATVVTDVVQFAIAFVIVNRGFLPILRPVAATAHAGSVIRPTTAHVPAAAELRVGMP